MTDKTPTPIEPPVDDRFRLRHFVFEGDDVASDIREKYGFDGDLLQMYADRDGPGVHKWHHYIPIYDRYFGRFRNTAVRMLEIGVSKGGSLKLWRDYLGPDAVITGVDIDEACQRHDGVYASVRIGSQDDPEFLKSVIDEMGGVDIVLDDGSHAMAHVRASLAVLFPRLSFGGVYMIEDLHTAFLPRYGGGLRPRRNFFYDLMPMIYDMHRWYHRGPAQDPSVGSELSGIHVHNSIVVLEKDRPHKPVHSYVGHR